MHTYTFRLRPGQDVRQEIESYAKKHSITAGVILSLVGGMKTICLRMAGGEKEITQGGPFEIVSATGTISADGIHIHVSVSDKNGQVFGGHLKIGCQVYLTAEVVIGHIIEEEFRREMDEETGYKELIVGSNRSAE